MERQQAPDGEESCGARAATHAPCRARAPACDPRPRGSDKITSTGAAGSIRLPSVSDRARAGLRTGAPPAPRNSGWSSGLIPSPFTVWQPRINQARAGN